MKDNAGDPIEVCVSLHDAVDLWVTDSHLAPPGSACACLSPKKARKLAKKLLRAADEIEAR